MLVILLWSDIPRQAGIRCNHDLHAGAHGERLHIGSSGADHHRSGQAHLWSGCRQTQRILQNHQGYISDCL